MTTRPVVLILLLVWFAAAAEPTKKDAEPKPPLSPEEALKRYRLDAGLKLELVAAEPDIESPVAMTFDEDGKLWVVEMRDYPNGPAPGQPPQGRIKVLEDKDGDGRYEHVSIFADNLLFANGLLRWRDGVIVTAAPAVLHLRDTDGDGKADRRDVLFEGFAAENPQLRVSHPNLGIDNWVYTANGLRGGQVKRAGQTDAKPLNVSGMDFRFNPLNPDQHEAISGLGQFGLTFDDWGRRFVCDNSHHLRHIVLPNRYIQRNPLLAVPAVLEDTSELIRGPLSSGGKIYPLSKNWTTSTLHIGRFTAACGVFIYRGDLLGPKYRGTAFTCDPTGNLVHQEILQPRGATFRSSPPREGVEFLASPDDWFRPVFLTHGPDGAMYLVDMYRAVIEHPEYMPQELKTRPDLNLGKERGRIWRIVPENHQFKAIQPQLSKASPGELVKLLEHPNAWWRTTAQRLLLQAQDAKALEPLRKLVTFSKQPLARVQAAWLLANRGDLNETLILHLLRDPHPRVREQAVVLAEPLLAKSEKVRQAVMELAGDPDARLRFQAALSLGEWDDDRILSPLASIALAGVDDSWTRTAVATAVSKRAGALLKTLLDAKEGLTNEVTAPRLTLVQELAGLIGSRRDNDEVAAALESVLDLAGPASNRWQTAFLNGLAEGMGRRGVQVGVFLKSWAEMNAKRAQRVEVLFAQSATVAADTKKETSERLAAIRLLAHANWNVAQPVLVRLLGEEGNQDVRLGAVAALAAQPRPEVAGLLMNAWPAYTPPLRREVIEAMLRQPDRVLFLLKVVEAGRVKPGDLDATRTNLLLNHGRQDIRDLAKKLLRDSLPQERKQVLERYQAALKLKSDAEKGKAVFQKHCATCHRVAAIGVDVGPDIADSRTKTPEQYLTDILNPNQAIDNNYINYVVATKSGKVLTGTIAGENASSITLKRAENQTDTILRQDVEEIRSTGTSLMPEGLEKEITVQDLADLINFLKNWRYLGGTVPVGKAEKEEKGK